MTVETRVLAERRVLRNIQPMSAAKVALALGLTLAAIGLVGFIALFLLGAASGALRSVEQFIISMGAEPNYRLGFLDFLVPYLIVSMVLTGLLTLLAALSALLYNILADVVGGIEVVVRER
ncbi:MAG TPA: DUF3566 domain-containing protein [Actinomycetota bacterium]|nr:DUF3566 domain-containing protein [Actinomycetota bacterium]